MRDFKKLLVVVAMSGGLMACGGDNESKSDGVTGSLPPIETGTPIKPIADGSEVPVVADRPEVPADAIIVSQTNPDAVYTSIADALASLPTSPAFILVEAGNYDETEILQINYDVVLLAEGDVNVSLAGIVIDGADISVKLQGFNFTRTSADASRFIRVSGTAASVEILDNVIVNEMNDYAAAMKIGGEPQPTDEHTTHDFDNVVFSFNEVSGFNGWSLININDYAKVEMSHNTFTDNGGAIAIRGAYALDGEDSSVVYTHNTSTFEKDGIDMEAWAALEINRTENVVVSNNEISGFYTNALWFPASVANEDRHFDDGTPIGEGMAMQVWHDSAEMKLTLTNNIATDNLQGVWLAHADSVAKTSVLSGNAWPAHQDNDELNTDGIAFTVQAFDDQDFLSDAAFMDKLHEVFVYGPIAGQDGWSGDTVVDNIVGAEDVDVAAGEQAWWFEQGKGKLFSPALDVAGAESQGFKYSFKFKAAAEMGDESKIRVVAAGTEKEVNPSNYLEVSKTAEGVKIIVVGRDGEYKPTVSETVLDASQWHTVEAEMVRGEDGVDIWTYTVDDNLILEGHSGFYSKMRFGTSIEHNVEFIYKETSRIKFEVVNDDEQFQGFIFDEIYTATIDTSTDEVVDEYSTGFERLE